MNSFVELLRLALDRGWALGLLLVVFCAGILIGPRYGLPLPALLIEWAGGGVLFGAAVVAVSVTSHVMGGMGAWLSRRRWRAEQAEEALANIAALSQQEFEALRDLLKVAPARIHVDYITVAHGLLTKGILVPVRGVSGSSWICKIHPAILERRDELLPIMDARLSDAEQRGSIIR